MDNCNLKNVCIYDSKKECRGIQIVTTSKTMCCDELDEILIETVSEIVSTNFDIIDGFDKHKDLDLLFSRGIRLLSYASNICPIETQDEKEIMSLITVVVNCYRKNNIEKYYETYYDFYDLLKSFNSWLRFHYLKEAGYFDFLDELIDLSLSIQSTLTNIQKEVPA